MVAKKTEEEVFNILFHIHSRRSSFSSSPCQNTREFLILASLIEECNAIDGSFAEVGAYEGFTSEFMCALKGKEKEIFLCDTFKGLADAGEYEPKLGNGALAVEIDRFKLMNGAFLDSYCNIVEGYFPESATKKMDESQYCFVHIDTDTYLSTLNSLSYFYNRMSNGGKIVVHDYINNDATLGVNKAVDEFMEKKKGILEIYEGSTQGVITKF